MIGENNISSLKYFFRKSVALSSIVCIIEIRATDKALYSLGETTMTYSDEQREMTARAFASRDGSMERPAFQKQADRDFEQIQENRDAMRFREPPYSEPSANNGEAALRAINNALLEAIESRDTQHSTSIWKDTFEDIEAHLENTGCQYGGWSYLECWFDTFAIAAGLSNQSLDDIAAPNSDKVDLIFSWD
jgi:hypothetical protein